MKHYRPKQKNLLSLNFSRQARRLKSVVRNKKEAKEKEIELEQAQARTTTIRRGLYGAGFFLFIAIIAAIIAVNQAIVAEVNEAKAVEAQVTSDFNAEQAATAQAKAEAEATQAAIAKADADDARAAAEAAQEEAEAAEEKATQAGGASMIQSLAASTWSLRWQTHTNDELAVLLGLEAARLNSAYENEYGESFIHQVDAGLRTAVTLNQPYLSPCCYRS